MKWVVEPTGADELDSTVTQPSNRMILCGWLGFVFFLATWALNGGVGCEKYCNVHST